jgi:hypothetical protein
MNDPKPQPLTEDQRVEVRNLLKQLSAQSSARASKRGTTRPQLRTTRRIKIVPNPFDGIDEGKTVQGTELSPDCSVLPFIQRTRIVLLPFHLDDIAQFREDWIKMIEDNVGCKLSVSDAGTREHLRFTVDSNPPVRYLHIYLTEDKETKLFSMTNFMYAT